MLRQGEPSRREFTAHTLAGLAGAALGFRLPTADHAGGIAAIEHRGVLIGECSLAGERRADDVVPAHPSGLQVSRDRWLLLCATRGFRGVDDDRSIVYQLRRDAPDGPVIKEGFLARSVDDWEPFGDGKKYVRQHGHPVALGVPKGILLKGKDVPHANLFVARWRVTARVLDPDKKLLLHATASEGVGRRAQAVEWAQFRLNAREDDIEILQPAGVMRQKGFEKGKAFCSAEGVRWMNQGFTPPVPFNADASEWADCNHFDGGRVAPIKLAYDLKSGRYEWVATGPFLSDPRRALSEGSLARVGDRWVLAARGEGKGGVAWALTDDPFARVPRPVYPAEPAVNAPLTAFACADGILRLFTGDASASPYKNGRDPLYCWDASPAENFACSGRRVIFDSVKAGLKIRPAASPKIDMAKLLPPQGRTQLLVHRVSVRAYNHPYVGGSGQATGIPPISAEEKACCGIYYARITYNQDLPPAWEFPRKR